MLISNDDIYDGCGDLFSEFNILVMSSHNRTDNDLDMMTGTNGDQDMFPDPDDDQDMFPDHYDDQDMFPDPDIFIQYEVETDMSPGKKYKSLKGTVWCKHKFALR